MALSLHTAVENDDHETVRDLLARGTNPNYRDVLSGYTPLHTAAASGNLGIVRLLCDSGAEINDRRNTVFSSALACAVVNGHADVVAYLLSRRADPSERLYGDDRLLADEAEATGNVAMAEMLRKATQKDEFFFNGMAVGILTGERHDQSGLWRYMPYRGPGHYDLSVKIEAGESAECRLGSDSGPRFVIRGIPEYGVLDVSEVDRPDQV